MNPDSAAIKLLDEAIAQHDEAIKQHKREREELVRAKLALAQTNGHPRSRSKGTQPAKDLLGVRLTDSIRAVLNGNGGKMEFTRLKNCLIIRGVRLGTPEKPLRFSANLKTAIVNNPRVFQFDKSTDMVSLVKA